MASNIHLIFVVIVINWIAAIGVNFTSAKMEEDEHKSEQYFMVYSDNPDLEENLSIRGEKLKYNGDLNKLFMEPDHSSIDSIVVDTPAKRLKDVANDVTRNEFHLKNLDLTKKNISELPEYASLKQCELLVVEPYYAPLEQCVPIEENLSLAEIAANALRDVLNLENLNQVNKNISELPEYASLKQCELLVVEPDYAPLEPCELPDENLSLAEIAENALRDVLNLENLNQVNKNISELPEWASLKKFERVEENRGNNSPNLLTVVDLPRQSFANVVRHVLYKHVQHKKRQPRQQQYGQGYQ